MKNGMFVAGLCLVGSVFAGLSATGSASAASVPYEFECVKSAAFVVDPNAHQRFGYVTSLNGFDLPGTGLSADLTVQLPAGSTVESSHLGIPLVLPSELSVVETAKVVGVIESFSWSGGVGDPIEVDFYVSQENAVKLSSIPQSLLANAVVKNLGWWMADYDQETNAWFEQAYPTSKTIAGIVAGAETPELNVDLTPVAAKDGIDVSVYKVSIKVAPGANQQYALTFANSSTTPPAVKQWGLTVGTLAASAF